MCKFLFPRIHGPDNDLCVRSVQALKVFDFHKGMLEDRNARRCLNFEFLQNLVFELIRFFNSVRG